MRRLKSSLITVGILLVVFVLLVIGFVFIPFRPGNALRVSYLGNTNDPTIGTLSLFAVINISNEKITIMPCEPQMLTYGEWPRTKGGGDIKIIPAHAITNFTMTSITNAGVWRQPVFWIYTRRSEIESVQADLKENIDLNWVRFTRRLMPRYYNMLNGTGRTAFSDIITNK